MNILYCTTVLPSGQRTGGEIVTQRFVDALRQAGHEVEVLGYRRPGQPSTHINGEHVAGSRAIETEASGVRGYIWLLGALFRNSPYSSYKYDSLRYRRLVRTRISAGTIDLFMVDHAQAGFLLPEIPETLPMVFVAHNVEETIYKQLQKDAYGLRRWLFKREARTIGTLERLLSKRAHETWTLTSIDGAHFRALHTSPSQVRVFDLPGLVPNQETCAEPPVTQWDVGLIGTWTWDANAKGLRWFVANVFPLLAGKARVAVAGKGADVFATAGLDLLGFVPNAFEFLRQCAVVAVPSVAGSGVQVKTLDAIAGGTPLVATSIAVRGIANLPESVTVTDDPTAFAAALLTRIGRNPAGIDSDAVAWATSRKELFDATVRSSITSIDESRTKLNGQRARMFGIEIDAVRFDEAIQAIVQAGRNRAKGLVVTPNVDHIVTLSENADFQAAYRKALFVFADGAPVVWFSQLRRRTRLPQRITGADLFPAICGAAADNGLTVAFVGGAPGVAERAATVLQSRIPDLVVAGCYSPPYGFEHDVSECERIITMVNHWKPDFLFVGVGSPKQELWAARHLARMEVGPVLCFGAAFDFVAGTVQRAPHWMQTCGMEWLWRLLAEPRRLAKRYLVRDAKFLPLALLELFRD